MKSKLFFLTVFIIYLSSSVLGQSKHEVGAEWVGTYEFDTYSEIKKPKNFKGTVPSVNYTLKLSKGNSKNGLKCKFSAVGHQKYDEYKCSVKTVGNTLSVYFQMDLVHEDDLEFVDFKKNQLLFSLAKMKIGNKVRYQFKPSAYKIYFVGSKRKSIYFKKISK